MSTADYALIISLFSVAVASASFVWSVWEKFIYPKAMLRVRFYVAVIIPGDGTKPPWPNYVCVSATNHGPGEITINNVGVVIRARWPWSKPQHALINPIASLAAPYALSGPFGGGLPRTLKVGETHSLYFPHEAQSFGRERLRSLGLFDSFDRIHNTPKRRLREVKRSLDKAFANQPYVSTAEGWEARRKAREAQENAVGAGPAALIDDVDDLDDIQGDD